jgi:hypothetical protein
MTTSDGPFADDVFLVFVYSDGSTEMVPMRDDTELLSRLQELPGFDDEAFIEAMGCAEETCLVAVAPLTVLAALEYASAGPVGVLAAP